MNDCEGTRELLPWYATGKLGVTDAATVIAHVQSCETCRQELAEVVWVRHTVRAGKADTPSVGERVWRRVMARVGFRNLANVDVGSFLVGLRLGVNARRPGSPVRASLHVMGRNVRIVGTKRRDECNAPTNRE